MTPERWARITEIFGQAMESGGAQRDAFVAQACGEDDELQREIQRLLLIHDQEGAFVDNPAVPAGALAEASSMRTFRTGQAVSGRFCITQFLGEGGMGEVYSARRSGIEDSRGAEDFARPPCGYAKIRRTSAAGDSTGPSCDAS